MFGGFLDFCHRWYGSANPGCTSSGQNYTTGIMIKIVMQLLPGSMFLEKLCEWGKNTLVAWNDHALKILHVSLFLFLLPCWVIFWLLFFWCFPFFLVFLVFSSLLCLVEVANIMAITAGLVTETENVSQCMTLMSTHSWGLRKSVGTLW